MKLISSCCRDFLRYDPRRKDTAYVEEAITLITGVGVGVASKMCYLVENEKRGGPCQKEHANPYERMVKTATKRLLFNV